MFRIKYILILLLIIAFSCTQLNNRTVRPKKHAVTLAEIKKRGVLRVVTDFNSTSYFIYRGQPMGYQYELLQELADYLDVKLDVRVNNNIKEKFKMLATEQVDLIAVNLTVTKDRKKYVDFLEPLSQTKQVLVQRKPEGWKRMSEKSLQDSMITNHLALAGQTIYVQKGSSYVKRMHNISNDIGDTIYMKEVKTGVEKLVEKVAKGEIDYTVCDENVALLNQSYYDNLDVSLALSFSQNLAWAVPNGATELKLELDEWLINFKKTKKYAAIYKKYYKNKRSFDRFESEYFSNNGFGNISPYDKYIKKYSEEAGWDWRLVASMIYQESRFNPDAKSWAGAFGLMQFMPATGQRFGVNAASSVERQIKAGINYINWLDKRLVSIQDKEERKKFVLASYNVGLGHILDARKLAEKYGKNPDIWENNVDQFILLKSESKYFNDPVVKHGYCRGTETYNYVSEIYRRYNHYKNLVGVLAMN